MINLYKNNESNFKHNAFVLSECNSCKCIEEINSVYEINLEYPLNDTKDISDLLVTGDIIKAPSWDDREPQLFVIRQSKPSLENKVVSCYAQAISIAKLSNNGVLAANIVGKTRKQAVQEILNNTINSHEFTIGNKDTNTSISNLDISRKSVLEALKGDNSDGSVLNTYGGEFVPNNFIVDFVDQRGQPNGITISYAQNITGAELTLEDTDTITEIIPVGANDLMLPEKSIKAYNFDANNPFTKFVEFNDIAIVEAEYDEDGNCTNASEVCTEQQAYEKLRKACNDKFNIEKVNEVNFNLTLNFLELADCINFEENDYSEIQNTRVAIGDTIKVNIKPLNINLMGRIYKITRDVLTGRLESAEIGYKKANIVTTITNTNKKIIKTDKKVEKKTKELKENIEKVDTNAKEATNNLKVTFEAKTNEIDISIQNVQRQTESSIQVLEDAISLKVSAGEFGTLIEQHYDNVAIAVKNKTLMQVIFDSFGETIHDGGLQVYSGSNRVFYFDNGNACLKDIQFDNINDANAFISSLMNLDELHLMECDFSAQSATFTDLDVHGSKNCIVSTENFGSLRINAYETCEYFFGDVGFGVAKEEICIIVFDNIFLETVNTKFDYHVFTQVYNCKSSINHIEKYENYCIIHCEKGTEFSWEIKAKRLGYENVRLEQKEVIDEIKKQSSYTSVIDTSSVISNTTSITGDIINTNIYEENNDLMEVIEL